MKMQDPIVIFGKWAEEGEGCRYGERARQFCQGDVGICM